MTYTTKYTTIKLPAEFVEKMVDSLIEDPSNGFTSRADVIKSAVRDYYNKQKGSKIPT